MSTQPHTPGPLEALKEMTIALADYEYAMHMIIGSSQHCQCGSFALAAECRKQWNGAERTIQTAKAAIVKAERGKKTALGFEYLAFIGGGDGQDVWDRECRISAEDIVDATGQAQGKAEEIGGWVYSVVQIEPWDDQSPALRDAAKDLLKVVKRFVAADQVALKELEGLGYEMPETTAKMHTEANDAIAKAEGRKP